MENSKNIELQSAKKQRIRNNIIFAILCVLIAMLLVIDFITITNAYFTASKPTNPSVITTGSVDFSYKVYDSTDTDITSNSPINLGTETILPGNEVHYKIGITNTGRTSCYIRMICTIEIEIDSVYVEKDILRVKSNDASKSFNLLTDSNNEHSNTIVYYKSTADNGVINVGSTVNIPVKFVIDEATEEFNNYSDRRYRIYLTIQSIQAPGVTLSNSQGWVDSQGNVISFE